MIRTLAARFFQSLSQLSWLPLPAFARGDTPCVGAYPLVGVLLGVVASITYILLLTVLPPSLAVVLALGAVWLITGATAESSAITLGPRAIVAVVALMLVRLLALLELTEDVVPMAFLVAMPLAQLGGVAALFALPPRAEGGPQEAPAGLYPAAISHRGRVAAVAFGVLPLLMLTTEELAAVLGVCVGVAAAVLLLLRRYYRTAQPRPQSVVALHITALVIEVAVYVTLNLAWESPTEPIVL